LRGGQLEKAEKIVDAIEVDQADATALTAYIDVQLARGKRKEAIAAARRIEELGPTNAHEFYYLLAVRLEEQRYDDLPELIRKAEKLIDPANGYPEIYLAEVMEGLPEFFEGIGPSP